MDARYPTPRTVWIRSPAVPSFFRIAVMWTSIVRSVTVTPGPIARDISWARDRIRPLAWRSAVSSRNSVRVVWMARPSTDTWWVSVLTQTGPSEWVAPAGADP